MFVEVFRDDGGIQEHPGSNWRWRLVSDKGDIIATSEDAYARRGSAKKAWGRVAGAVAGNVRVVEVL